MDSTDNEEKKHQLIQAIADEKTNSELLNKKYEESKNMNDFLLYIASTEKITKLNSELHKL